MKETPRELQERMAEHLMNREGRFGKTLVMPRALALHIAGHLVEMGWRWHDPNAHHLLQYVRGDMTREEAEERP